jgi:hypothetical protein
LPLIVLVWVVRRWLQIVLADASVDGGFFNGLLIDHLPEHLEDRRQFAYNLMPKAMNAVFGPQPTAWETFKNPSTRATWIRVKK